MKRRYRIKTELSIIDPSFKGKSQLLELEEALAKRHNFPHDYQLSALAITQAMLFEERAGGPSPCCIWCRRRRG